MNEPIVISEKDVDVRYHVAAKLLADNNEYISIDARWEEDEIPIYELRKGSQNIVHLYASDLQVIEKLIIECVDEVAKVLGGKYP